MATLELRALISKLNPLSRQCLEQAIASCAAQMHFNVEIEHFLFSILQNENSQAIAILNHFNIDPSLLMHKVDQEMKSFKTGNNRTPSFSAQLLEWLHRGWLASSLEFDLTSISSGSLLYALLNTNELMQQTAYLADCLKAVNLQVLKEQFHDITAVAKESASFAAPATLSNQQKQSALAQFTLDLTESAKNGKLDPVIGRDQEIQQMIDILSRRRQNNPLLVGEAGVGKTAVAEGLAIRIIQGTVPDKLKNVRLLLLDLTLLQAGASVKGEFENRLKSVIEAVKSSEQPIILFIDEAHNLIGAGNQAGQGDAANLLKPALARGELRTIAATTWAEYKKFFEKDAALTRRFQPVKIDEPDESTGIAILRGLAEKLEEHHHVKILDEALVAAVQLSKRYLPHRQLPDKAVSLLDTACARVHLSQNSCPQKIEDLQQRLIGLEHEINLSQRESVLGLRETQIVEDLKNKYNGINSELTKLQEQWDTEKQLFEKVRTIETQMPKLVTEDPATYHAQLEILQQIRQEIKSNQENMVQLYVDAFTIAQIIANWTGIPVYKMLSNQTDDVLNLADKLKERVIGQDHALESIAQSVKIARAQLADPRKPIGVFLLLGLSGTGKTETALALAELLFGNEQSLITINMSEFKEEHKISMLTGSPAGYVGYGEGGILTEAVRRKPYSVVLLDEIEKAHRGIQDIFYQVFDKGILVDGEGKAIDFKNTIIILTSNVGSQTLSQLEEKNLQPEHLKEILHDELLNYFKPAFLNRVTVIPYLPLNEEILSNIARMQLQKVADRLNAAHGYELEYDTSLIDYLISQCNFLEAGARSIELNIHSKVLTELSNIILAPSLQIEDKNKIILQYSIDRGIECGFAV